MARKAAVNAVRVLYLPVCSMLVALCLTLGAQGAGLGMEGGVVTLDFGQVVPGRSVVWPGMAQLRVFADTPWHVSLRAEGDLSDARGRIIPVERLSWSLADETGT
ncbi:MAG: hypothetical protein ACOYEP_07615 [Limnochordia bacterium]|jgi:hypothetical protein